MKTPEMKLAGYEQKTYLDAADISKILGVGLSSAYDVIHELPYFDSGRGGLFRVRREIFEEYLKNREQANVIMRELYKERFITLEGRQWYIRSKKGRTMTLQLCNF